ncbi:MAG: flagellar protein FlaG [Firmicutes bacterium]|nr:flagellar protein FlaG [Bacillota bacterium]
MQAGSIDTNVVDFVEYGLNLDAVKASRTPAEVAQAQKVYEKAKHKFNQAVSSSKLDKKTVEKLMEDFNELAEAFNIQLRFSVKKEGPDHINVKVVNVKTNEVIREIPMPKFSKVGSRLLDAVGLIIDKIA